MTNKNWLRLHFHQWLDEFRISVNLTNIWLSSEKLYYDFSLYLNKTKNEETTYNIFLRKLNIIQSCIGYIYIYKFKKE